VWKKSDLSLAEWSFHGVLGFTYCPWTFLAPKSLCPRWMNMLEPTALETDPGQLSVIYQEFSEFPVFQQSPQFSL
jgi:hypothetical protein